MDILVIEDDLTINKNIAEAVKNEGWNAESVYDGLLAERLLKQKKYDCVIMDVNLPGKTGFDLCKDFRKGNTETPILMLTAFSQIEDKVLGFELGVDDYLTKPFFMKELIMRIHVLLKRTTNQASANHETSQMVLGDIIIDNRLKKVTRQDQEIMLTPREYQILVKLCENNGEIVSKSELIKEIWGKSVDANTNTIEVYVNFLRNKVDKPFGKNSIKTKIGFGYYIDMQ